MILKIREYHLKDKNQVIQMMTTTIQSVNSKDYDQSQINVWSAIDPKRWDAGLTNYLALVAIQNNQIVGFADMDLSGYLDQLFVDRNYQRQGIARQLVTTLEKRSPAASFSSFASITARPFFEAMGYHVVKKHIAELRGETFINYFMIK